MELETRLVYGPVRSRRFGWDLGINLLPTDHKLCTFDCIYCQYGLTPPSGATKKESHPPAFPAAGEIVTEWQEQIRNCRDRSIPITHTTISGNGEPSMHPHFAEVIDTLVRWRDQNEPQIRLAILTNGYRLKDAKIRKAICSLDEPIVKLDCADPQKIHAVDRPLLPHSLKELVANLKKCPHIMIQTMFIKGWNDSSEDLAAWKSILRQIHPEMVQIYTISRSTAVKDLSPVDKKSLEQIAADASTSLGIPVQAFH